MLGHGQGFSPVRTYFSKEGICHGNNWYRVVTDNLWCRGICIQYHEMMFSYDSLFLPWLFHVPSLWLCIGCSLFMSSMFISVCLQEIPGTNELIYVNLQNLGNIHPQYSYSRASAHSQQRSPRSPLSLDKSIISRNSGPVLSYTTKVP